LKHKAPCEAEAQCCALVKAGLCYAVATEDMDALTFGTDVLLRHLTFSEARYTLSSNFFKSNFRSVSCTAIFLFNSSKMPIKEFHYKKILDGLNMTECEFIDLCILLGCDYCESIRGIGPKRAIELIQKYKTIEAIIENIDGKKYQVPENWLFKEARELFLHPDVTDPLKLELKWTDVDEEGLVAYMATEKGFR
jgi:flap endonuclease-1